MLQINQKQIEMQTHAYDSIVFLHFVTLWPSSLTYWPENSIACRISQGHFLYQERFTPVGLNKWITAFSS